MIFKDGQVAGTKVGALPKSKLVEWSSRHLTLPSHNAFGSPHPRGSISAMFRV